MKIDISLWNSPYRMRKRMKNLGVMVLTMSAMCFYLAISTKSWIIAILDVIYFLGTIPMFMSLAKWEKEPPKEVEESVK